MSIVIELPRELESELSVSARRFGVSVQDYVLQLISSSVERNAEPKTGKELVEYWQREGLIGTHPEINDSQAHARQLRTEAEQRMA